MNRSCVSGKLIDIIPEMKFKVSRKIKTTSENALNVILFVVDMVFFTKQSKCILTDNGGRLLVLVSLYFG